jgi:hypothetical protein
MPSIMNANGPSCPDPFVAPGFPARVLGWPGPGAALPVTPLAHTVSLKPGLTIAGDSTPPHRALG